MNDKFQNQLLTFILLQLKNNQQSKKEYEKEKNILKNDTDTEDDDFDYITEENSNNQLSLIRLNNLNTKIEIKPKSVENDYLKFGRYDEPRPIINENGNKIPWRDTSALEDINTIIQYQHMNLQKLIK